MIRWKLTHSAHNQLSSTQLTQWESARQQQQHLNRLTLFSYNTQLLCINIAINLIIISIIKTKFHVKFSSLQVKFSKNYKMIYLQHCIKRFYHIIMKCYTNGILIFLSSRSAVRVHIQYTPYSAIQRVNVAGKLPYATHIVLVWRKFITTVFLNF